jgi:hypothetical protein
MQPLIYFDFKFNFDSAIISIIFKILSMKYGINNVIVGSCPMLENLQRETKLHECLREALLLK